MDNNQNFENSMGWVILFDNNLKKNEQNDFMVMNIGPFIYSVQNELNTLNASFFFHQLNYLYRRVH